MRLISCHIENFGKLNNYSLEFNRGTNVIFEDNGYGKSTLSVFLRVMLYGFDNETKKGELTRERTKYAPWQGGNYGGSVVLEIEDRRLLITRQFGKKESDDFLEVRDVDTMLLAEGFDKNIGEQIFGIDSDSFKRSVMFSQNDCETSSTDGINAKLGNLTESTDDINNFEKVDESLHKYLNEMTDSRKTGQRYKLKENIFDTETELRKRSLLEAEYHAKLELLENEKVRIKQLGNQIDDIKNRKNEEALNRSFYVVQEQYEKLLKEKYELENTIASIQKNNYLAESIFDSGIPSEDSLNDINNSINMLADLRSQKSGEEFSFSELADYNRLSTVFDRKANPIAELDEALHLLDEYDGLGREQINLDSKMAAIGYVDSSNSLSGKIKAGIAVLVLGAVAVLLSIVLYSMKWLAAGITYGIAVLGIILIVIAIIAISITKTKLNENRKKYDEYCTLDNRIKEIDSIRSDNMNKLVHILKEYNITYDKYDAGRRICRLRDDYDYYKRLSERKLKFDMEGNSVRITNICDELNAFFKPYEPIIADGDFSEKFYSLRTQIRSYELFIEKKKNLNELKGAIKKMEEAPDFLAIKEAHKPEENDNGADDTLLLNLDSEVEKANTNCLEYRKRIESLEEQLDELSDKEEELNQMKDELEQLNDKARLVELTRNYLNEAKIAFVKRYSEPITNNFRKYFELLDGSNSADYSFDANTNLNIYSQGKLRKPEAFSRGMRDLAGIAFRMSLTEAMYKHEKPYLIMDDPFVNLDDTRINGAMKLIERISDEYQVIYFTCSASRVPQV